MSLSSIWTRPLTVRINRGQSFSVAKKGLALNMLRACRLRQKIHAAPETIRLQIETPCYQRNVEETKLATISEQMRLLYVAMTRAEAQALPGRKRP